MTRKLLFAILGGVFLSLPTFAQSPIEAKPVDNHATYTHTGTGDDFIYDQSNQKYYAFNNLGQYEEYGLYPEVSTLKVAGATQPVEIEYIETTADMAGSPYINTGYYFTADTNVDMEFAYGAKKGSDWNALFGARSGYVATAFAFFLYTSTDTKGVFNRGSQEKRGDVDIPTNTKLHLTTSGVTCTIVNSSTNATVTTITNDNAAGALNSYPMSIFGVTNWSNGFEAKNNPTMKLYSFKIYEGSTLMMDFVPVVTSEGKGALKDKISGNIYTSPNGDEFGLSADGVAEANNNGITVYEGKIVINTTDGHAYKYVNGSWVDQGALTYETVNAIGTDYRNLSNWTHDSYYDSTFGVNVYDATTGSNTLNPYEGKGGWEPLSYKLTGLTKDETYRVSFNFTCADWAHWGAYSGVDCLPFYVFDTESMPYGDYNPGASGPLAYIPLPRAATSNVAYSKNFTAAHNFALLCIQFGVVDDGSHTPAYSFSFNDIKVEHRVCPAYDAITWADPVKYTELAYIESTGAVRENAFTLPYTPITATQIGIKFNVYDTSSGWCAVFCARNMYAGTGISLYKNGDNAHFGYFTGSTGGGGDNFASFSFNNDYTVVADVTNLNINGTDIATGNTVTNATTRNLSLFANPEWDNPMRGRIYYCTISEGNETIYEFKPVMRHDGVFGYYDRITKTFVQPAQGSYAGYGYELISENAYVYYPAVDSRVCIEGMTAQYLPTVQNINNPTFTWTSSDTSVATVAADGTVTGVAPGTATITATTDADQGWTASYELTVSSPTPTRYDKNGVGYAVISGGNGWNDSPLSDIVDNNANTKFGCSNVGDAWATFIASAPVAVSQYSFVTAADTYNYPARNPRSWKLEGSNDNQTWTVIDQHTDFDAYKIHFVNKEEFVFPVNDATTYKFFKFSALSTGDGFQLGEFWINEQSHTWGEATVTAATCTAEGKSVQECSDCHALKTTVIPVTAHNYVDGVCSVCGAKAYEVVLLPDGQTNPYTVKFRHMNGSDNPIDIETGWNTVAFDDSAWDELVMPIGSAGYDNGAHAGARYNTHWFNEYNTYWFRRTFTVDNPSQVAKLVLKVLHDDDYKVYVNGTLVSEANGWTNGTGWLSVDVNPALLVQGTNVVAMYIEQNFGGAYCDFSLTDFKAASVTISSALYATYVPPFNVTTEGSDVTAFKVISISDGWVHMTEVEQIPAGQPVVVGADDAGTYLLNTARTASELTDNILQVVGEPIEVNTEKTYYGLARPENKPVGFYPIRVGKTIPAGKVYYKIVSGNAKDFYALFEDDVNGIEGIIIDRLDGTQEIYNIRGQKLNKLERGINIVNGKKVIVK